METYDSLVRQEISKYGHIRLKLAEVMKKKGISRNKLKNLVGGNYAVITRYHKGENIQMVDLDLFARVCCVLHCDISDLLEYVPEPREEDPKTDPDVINAK